MNQGRAPIILSGQVYLNEDLNEYLIVTKNNLGQISYSGIGFKGQLEGTAFINHFLPVDPLDIEPVELRELLNLCPIKTEPKIGFIMGS